MDAPQQQPPPTFTPPTPADWGRFLAAFLAFTVVAALVAAAATRLSGEERIVPAWTFVLGWAVAYLLFAAAGALLARRRPTFRWGRWATGVALFSAICFGVGALLGSAGR